MSHLRGQSSLCNVSSCILNHVSNLVTIAWPFILTFYLPRIATEYPLLQIWHSPSSKMKSQEETLLPPAMSWWLCLFVGVYATILVQHNPAVLPSRHLSTANCLGYGLWDGGGPCLDINHFKRQWVINQFTASSLMTLISAEWTAINRN